MYAFVTVVARNAVRRETVDVAIGARVDYQHNKQ
jgi:hypothetical protein